MLLDDKHQMCLRNPPLRDIVGGMAPQVSLADDIERLSACVAALARALLAGKVTGPRLDRAAAAAGLSAPEAAAFLRGEAVLPSRQSVALVAAVLEQDRLSAVSYMDQLKRGHAGSDMARGSYAEKVTEKAARAGQQDHTWCRGGPLEASAADVEATLGRLRTDFAGWDFGRGADEPGLPEVWRARHDRLGRVTVFGSTSLELAEKVQRHEADWATEQRRFAAYLRG
jgi:hypothetical protein